MALCLCCSAVSGKFRSRSCRLSRGFRPETRCSKAGSLASLPSIESARVFELLQNRVTRLENTVRWSWQQDDVAMWDNRAIQHFAINEYGTQPRWGSPWTVSAAACAADPKRPATNASAQSSPPPAWPFGLFWNRPAGRFVQQRKINVLPSALECAKHQS